MLTPDVMVEDFTEADWVRLGALFPSRSRRMAGGGLIALTDDGNLVKLVSTARGRLDPNEPVWPSDLAEMAASHGASWAARVSRGALDTAIERWGARLSPGDSLTRQMLELLSVFRDLEAEGALELWPRRLSSFPLLSERIVEHALDAICPVGKAVVFAAFEDGELSTCLAAHRAEGGFDRIVGPEQLRREMGLLSGDWSRDYRHLARAVELGVGPLTLGCFAEVATWQRLASDRSPGAWAAAVAVRDVVLHPVVPAVAIPLGIDVGRVAYAAVRGLGGRIQSSWLFGEESPLGPTLRRVRELAGAGGDLEGMLGFDPITLLLTWLDSRAPRD